MEDCLHTSSDNLSKLVRWAHSHGTICSLIPGLKHLLTEGSSHHGILTAMWGCGAGHAYHWPLSAPCRPGGQKERPPCYSKDNRGVLGEALGTQPNPGVAAGDVGERFLARSSKAKGGGGAQTTTTRDSCDFSNCSEPSEGDDNTEELSSNLFDMACESSAATDEDGEYEPQTPPRKRGGRGPGVGEDGDAAGGKRIKQEMTESYYSVAQTTTTPGTDSDQRPSSSSMRTSLSLGYGLPHKPSLGDGLSAASSSSSPHTSLGAKPLYAAQPSPRLQEQCAAAAPGQSLSNLEENHRPPGGLGSEESLRARRGGGGGLSELKPELDPLAEPEHALGNGSTDGIGETPAGPALCEIQRLRALLHAERSRAELLGETVSSLRQDKELLQQELTKKAELICDFLQDQLRPDKRRNNPSNHVTHPSNHMTHPSNHMAQPSNHMTHLSSHMVEPGSSHMGPFVEEAAFDSPVLFDTFDEVELHPLDHHRKTKRSRDGENTRVRMKNVVGVIARYMASLQEFRRSVSMKVAFDRVGVDRNTISRTAAIAELSLAAPEVFHALAPWDEKEETLAHYAHRCRQAMDDNIKAKIKNMKAKGDLLPIVSK